MPAGCTAGQKRVTRINHPGRQLVRKVRPPVVRQWRGPLIGREPESVDNYLERMTRLVADARTLIYFDASFLMWLAKLGEDSRAEFLAWQNKVGEQRFHVPLWAAHEFFKHRLKRTISGELNKEIKAFDSAASSLYEKLRVYCSDGLFGFKNSGNLFLDEYRRTVQPLRAMLKLAENSDQFELAVQQVALYIDRRLLSGPLHEIMDDIEADERVRNRGVIPPSFKDAHKRGGKRTEILDEEPSNVGDNSFGDLAFWREVLRHAVSLRAASVVVLTGDRKNDWFENHHGDKGLTVEIRKKLGRPRPVPAPHPLLLREAYDRGAGDLSLIDPMYCGVLMQRAGGPCANFAAAALDTHLPEPLKKPTAARSWATRFGAGADLVGGRPDLGDGSELAKESFDFGSLTLELFKPSSAISVAAERVIQQIVGGDLLARAHAFAMLTADTLDQWDLPSLVVLGRTTLRVAEADDPTALDFLSNLRDRVPDYPATFREPFYFGALTALYFGDDLQKRQPQGSLAAAVLLSLVNAPEVCHAASAVGTAIGDRTVLYRPGQNVVALSVNLVTQGSADNKAPADLLAIKLGGIDLITLLQTEHNLRFTTLLGRPAGFADIQVGALLEVLARFHLLPRQLIQIDVNTNTVVRVPEFAGVELDV